VNPLQVPLPPPEPEPEPPQFTIVTPTAAKATSHSQVILVFIVASQKGRAQVGG
jgi:hypothetical protein